MIANFSFCLWTHAFRSVGRLHIVPSRPWCRQDGLTSLAIVQSFRILTPSHSMRFHFWDLCTPLAYRHRYISWKLRAQCLRRSILQLSHNYTNVTTITRQVYLDLGSLSTGEVTGGGYLHDKICAPVSFLLPLSEA
jgi:hypothetical protein